MKYALLTIVTLLIAAQGSLAAVAPKDSGEARKSFYSCLAAQFHFPESSVVAVKERGVSDEDLVVVCFLAKQAGIRPGDVADLRLLRKSWMELTQHFGLSPEVFFVPGATVETPPFTKAFAPFKKYRKIEWKKIVLGDDDIINLVNLRFVSGYYKVSVDEVIRLRAEGKSFVAIVKEITSPEYKARTTVTDKKVRPHLREPIKKPAQPRVQSE